MCGDGEWCGPIDPETSAAVLAFLEREAPMWPLPQCAPALGVHQDCEHDPGRVTR
jgi:hypothetical protein